MTIRRIDETAGDSGSDHDTDVFNVAAVAQDATALDVTRLQPNGDATLREPQDAGVELRDVTFRYRAAAEPVVDHLTLDVADGDHLVIVGPSGTGKSTLAALLVGLLSPQDGTIRHGGLPPEDVPASSRVLIPQEAYVFRGTLRENLAYYRPTTSLEALDAAVAALAMEELVGRLGGYEAELQPKLLSAGERQLVALARAYLSSARLMVLDEATCHLDPPAEAVAERAFAARPGTLVVVAHRISSAARGRRVLLMDGPHTAHGSHEELVARSPAYGSLVGHWEAEPTLIDNPIT
jgi:ABC-type multidrug transport system fused ATPase/permease subunit